MINMRWQDRYYEVAKETMRLAREFNEAQAVRFREMADAGLICLDSNSRIREFCLWTDEPCGRLNSEINLKAFTVRLIQKWPYGNRIEKRYGDGRNRFLPGFELINESRIHACCAEVAYVRAKQLRDHDYAHASIVVEPNTEDAKNEIDILFGIAPCTKDEEITNGRKQ